MNKELTIQGDKYYFLCARIQIVRQTTEHYIVGVKINLKLPREQTYVDANNIYVKVDYYKTHKLYNLYSSKGNKPKQEKRKEKEQYYLKHKQRAIAKKKGEKNADGTEIIIKGYKKEGYKKHYHEKMEKKRAKASEKYRIKKEKKLLVIEQKSNEHIIYKYTSPEGKSYIGYTCNEKIRKRQHRKPDSGCKEFVKAQMKYGYINFEYEVLERHLTLEQAKEKEEFYIEHFNTIMPNGYNMIPGGDYFKGNKGE